MPIPTLAWLVLGSASLFEGFQSYKATRETKKVAKNQELDAEELRKKEERQRMQAAMRKARRRGAAGGPGLRDTILTGPLGIPNAPAGGGKTLLGL